eukprot:Polyplicarium_translucidae@DN3282_c0_g2_i11.p1
MIPARVSPFARGAQTPVATRWMTGMVNEVFVTDNVLHASRANGTCAIWDMHSRLGHAFKRYCISLLCLGKEESGGRGAICRPSGPTGSHKRIRPELRRKFRVALESRALLRGPHSESFVDVHRVAETERSCAHDTVSQLMTHRDSLELRCLESVAEMELPCAAAGIGNVSQPHCMRMSQPHCMRMSQPHCMRMSQPHCMRMSQPHCMRMSQPHCTACACPNARTSELQAIQRTSISPT